MRKQRGVSFIGFIFLAVFLGFFAVIGFKLAPVYSEYFTIKKILNAVAQESREASPAETRRIFERKIDADYVDSVKPGDLEINKEGGQVVLSVSYSKKVPLIANVSLLVEFEAVNKR